jgi:hypothetical protein
MAKTRVLSQSKALYVTKTGTLYGDGTSPSGVEATQLHRINSFSYEVDIAGARQDIRVFGQLARIGTVTTSDLTPTCSFGYLLTDGENEHHLGMEIEESITGAAFQPAKQGISGYLTESADHNERNLFAVTVAEGEDAFAAGAWANRNQHDVVGFGNAFVTEYSVDMAVGDIPTANVSMECGNIAFYTGKSSGLFNPSINPAVGTKADTGAVVLPVASTGDSAVDVLRDGQISLDLQDATNLGIGGAKLAEVHPQSISLSVPLAREALTELGNDLPYSRPLTFPIDVTLSVNALTADMTEGQTAGLLTGCAGQVERLITVKLYDRCDPSILRLGYALKAAVLDNISFSTDLDGAETVDMSFSAQIAGASNIEAGFFMTGDYLTSNASPLNPTLIGGMTSA